MQRLLRSAARRTEVPPCHNERQGLQHGGVGCRYLDISKPDKFNPYETVLADQIKAALKLRHDSLSSIKLG